MKLVRSCLIIFYDLSGARFLVFWLGISSNYQVLIWEFLDSRNAHCARRPMSIYSVVEVVDVHGMAPHHDAIFEQIISTTLNLEVLSLRNIDSA
ncbi:hypothetical protein HBI56_004560 [Parastagonospora nodorum]|uniref:Uncharacterized protein n=1 Tax=Phaeosphaeria nodorum (strain SN15 / ATCC MYA-4574 / FGSC 10173) TaxID=321614 RepID=A0A7U2ER40_PHANO|nr:hypothetical protein HBH56_136490 [Parastagonospora nodorum]QRC91266.1 hypothetical protein JI435_401140 [Parastagonospora nodorum SN15]KAH3928015.1 hypothetical protein HBH54_141620 [Parastagonospora nodorum]KAH3949042.1 hypothetical protein HBH53_091600 [Parastagonospora nodorum]KAH3972461.1 hypothetical protein HBH52_153600 [Parastagonospora nodorum]